MSAVLTSIALLACPITMGLMMVMTMRSSKPAGHGQQSGGDARQIQAEITEPEGQRGPAGAAGYR